MIPLILQDIDKTRPMTDAQYAAVRELSDKQKAEVMNGFSPAGWSEADIKRHYLAAHYPVLRYGPKWTLTPPKTKK